MQPYEEAINTVMVKPARTDVLEEIAALASQYDIEGLEEKDEEVVIYLSKKISESKDWKTLEHDFKNRYNAEINYQVLESKNWNAIWESEFTPIQIDNFINIRAPFHPPSDMVDFDLIIQPKMSFGTGHHATTYLMINQ